MNHARLEAQGRLVAERHATAIEADPDRSLVNYAESPRVGDWSMRSALVRFAQPQPELAGELLDLVRRLDTVLHHVARTLEKRTVLCDRSITGDQPKADRYPDTRTADLARLARADSDGFPAVLAGYEALVALEPDERAALPLLEIALELDELADVLAVWADRGPDDPPDEVVAATCGRVRARMDDLGVPTETRPPGRGRP